MLIEELIRHLVENPDILKGITQGTISLIGVSQDETNAIINVLSGEIIKPTGHWN